MSTATPFSTCSTFPLAKRDMFLEHTRTLEERHVVENLLNKVENILINGTQIILNPVYQNIGFDKINDDILKHLVVSRICQPQSKVATDVSFYKKCGISAPEQPINIGKTWLWERIRFFGLVERMRTI